jgi:hypothetical protein
MRGQFTLLVMVGIGLGTTICPAVAECERGRDQAVRATGRVDDAWIDRAGRAMYLLDSGDPDCATEGYQTYVRDPLGKLRCRAGQSMTVAGRFEPVWFDFTGSGYLIRADRLSCA